MNTYYLQKGFCYFKFDFNTSLIADIKAIEGRRYNSQTKEWYVETSLINNGKIKAIIDKYGFENNEKSSLLGKKLDNSIVNSISIEEENEGIEEIKKDVAKLNLNFTPRPFQYKGIFYMSVWGNMILGDDCGLGKTLQTIFTAELNNWFPCIVICPASTNYQWGEKWKEANPNRSVSVIDKPKTDNWEADVVIVKCTSLAKSEGEIIKYGKEVKNILPKYPELLRGWKYCVIDEIHYFKEKKISRSQVVKKIADKSEIVLGLSGTLILNKTKEVINPLILTKQFTKLFGTWQKFVERYCNATKTHFGWDTNGSSNLMELNSILNANCYLRREKSEVRKDQPPVQESYYYVDITNKKEYQRAENDFINWLVKSVKDESKTVAALNAESLVQRSYLKKLSVKGKMKAIKQWIDDFLETSNEKLIVAGMHTEPLEELTNHYKSKLINGSVSSIKKREMVKDFAKNKARLLFVQIQSVGTGTDGLQESCSNMLVFELPDRPTDLIQLYARIDRDGQKDTVNINLALCKETIDEVIWQSLKRKDITTSAVNKGIDTEEESVGKNILTFYLNKVK